MTRFAFLCAFALSCGMLAAANAIAGVDGKMDSSPALDKIHNEQIAQLSASQAEAVSSVYPDFRLLTLCRGRFSGAERDELVLGVWKPVDSESWWKRELHRVGLIWTTQGWEVHIIDDELEKDSGLSRSSPMLWDFTVTPEGFRAGMKCGINGEFPESVSHTNALGDKPFFDLDERGLSPQQVVCFATSDVYDNWDCVVFGPKANRFLLWYQQARAD